ncbi:hypothetical protein KEJ18_07135 [Candidatus Bathyarchaeota archaeon]|nr:hypothetical protein [Candidatus Bathyarchaeota archaeon]
MTEKRIAIFVPLYDVQGKKDATRVFQPEAQRFEQFTGRNGLQPEIGVINNKMPQSKMTDAVLTLIQGFKPLSAVAFFCHGTSRKIQLGFDLNNVSKLANAIAEDNNTDIKVILYCCLTGSGTGTGGDGGFADKLRDCLCCSGATSCRVVAHTTAGHATRNPFVRFFEGMGSKTGGTGGYYPVEPKSKLWQAWIKKLKEDSEFRFKFPFMAIEDIHSELMQ